MAVVAIERRCLGLSPVFQVRLPAPSTNGAVRDPLHRWGYVADRVSGQRWVSLKGLESIALRSHTWPAPRAPPRGLKEARRVIFPRKDIFM